MYFNQTQEESMAIFEINSTDGKGIIQNLNSRISNRLFPITILIGTEAVIETEYFTWPLSEENILHSPLRVYK